MDIACGQTLIANAKFADRGGTLGCILRNADTNDGVRYALTCQHVVWPDGAQVGDEDCIDVRTNTKIGKVAQITDRVSTGIDAALVRLTPGLTVDISIGSLGRPRGRTGYTGVGREISYFGAASRTPTSRSILQEKVDCPIVAGGQDCSLLKQVLCEGTSQQGDSGAAVLDRNRLLLGIVFGDFSGQTVISPIGPILDALSSRAGFQLEPWVGDWDDPSNVPPSQPPTADAADTAPDLPPWLNPGATAGAPPAGADATDALETLAWTLWGEAANDWNAMSILSSAPADELRNTEPYRAIAEVVVNRIPWGHQGSTVVEICRRPAQFTCWTKDPKLNPGFSKMQAPSSRAQKDFQVAQRVAKYVLAGWDTGNLTKGATHYYANSIPTPYWAVGKRPVAQIGHHLFFKGID